VKRFVYAVITLGLIPAAHLHAQSPTIDDLKGKIFDAGMAKQTFAKGLPFCKELDGKNFYFAPRDRVLNLEDYHRSLESLARQGVFNPETKRPWTEQDATNRWEQVQKQAIDDKDSCDLVASLPDLQKQLDDLEKKAAAPDKKN
jgi:hypothetical protein